MTVFTPRLCGGLFLGFFLAFSPVLPAQSILDYQREEYPAMSLNGVPYGNARTLTYYGNPLLAQTPLNALVNPAAVPDHNRVSFSGIHIRHAAFQYWGINDGVLVQSNPLTAQRIAFTSAVLSFCFSRTVLTAGYAENALRAFPSFEYKKVQRYMNLDYRYLYQGDFSGAEKIFFLSIKRSLRPGLDAGLTLSLSRTLRQLLLIESWDIGFAANSNWINKFLLNQRESHQLDHIALLTGIRYSPTDQVSAALALSLPFRGNAQRRIERGVAVPSDRRFSEHHADDPLQSPISIKASIMTILPLRIRNLQFRTGADLFYTIWSSHSFTFFGEDYKEPLKNTLRVALSLSASLLTSFGFLDMGLSVAADPQPLIQPESRVRVWSTGLSWRQKWLEIDVSLARLAAPVEGKKIAHNLLSLGCSILF